MLDHQIVWKVKNEIGVKVNKFNWCTTVRIVRSFDIVSYFANIFLMQTIYKNIALLSRGLNCTTVRIVRSVDIVSYFANFFLMQTIY